MSGAGPGSSRYLYERLDPGRFQQMCAALLKQADQTIRCVPVGQADGGVDQNTRGELVIYQSKSTSKAVSNPLSFVKEQVRDEEGNIRRLAAQGATAYWFMTNVQASPNPKNPKMREVDEFLLVKGKELGLKMFCEWRADLDARLDSSPDALKWSYADILAGWDLIRFLLSEQHAADQDEQLRLWLVPFIATQHADDRKDKFVQIELNRHNMQDLFVDVGARALSEPAVGTGNRPIAPSSMGVGISFRPGRPIARTARYLCGASFPFTFLRGAPGQGKSTLTQYLCQLHRSFFLEQGQQVARGTLAKEQVRFPIRIDLRDYAAWRAGADPFSADAGSDALTLARTGRSGTRKARGSRAGRKPDDEDLALESFIAYLVRHHSAGAIVVNEDVKAACKRLPLLVVLDGLDEVGNEPTRTLVVKEIHRFIDRMKAAAVAPQVIVTSRPNASALAEPDPSVFEVIALSELDDVLRDQYLTKWAAVHELNAHKAHDLRKVFRDRVGEPHVAELAANPMQLSILLHIISQRGDAVPTARAPLYEAYMETLLDREQVKTPSVRENRRPLKDVTSYLGWRLQAAAEEDRDGGRLKQRDIKRLMADYLIGTQQDAGLVEDLFRDATDKVWTLTSKIDDTYEFDVQSLREYFAARYLSDLAGDEAVRYDRTEVLAELLRRPYWLNTARFFAGRLPPNELPALIDNVEQDLFAFRSHSLQVRAGLWTLLADGVFSGRPRSQARITAALADWHTVALLPDLLESETVPVIPSDRGAEQLAPALLSLVKKEPDAGIAVRAIDFALRTEQRPDKIRDWWVDALTSADTTEAQERWLELARPHRLARNCPTDVLDTLHPLERQPRSASLLVGADAPSTPTWQPLIHQAVLSGLCSDFDPTTPSIESATLLALHPSRVLARASRNPVVGDGFPELISQQRLDSAWKRLKDHDVRWADVRKAARTGAGQSGTTSTWANTASRAAAILGPCWLTAEIAVIAAASDPQTHLTGGDLSPSPHPLGDDPNYTLLIELTRRNYRKSAWWASTLERFTDDLSRATWAVALLGIAHEQVVVTLQDRLEATLAGLPADLRATTALASSRLGRSGVARRLTPDALRQLAGSGPGAALPLLLHHVEVASITSGLIELDDRVLTDIAALGLQGWPARQALEARFRRDMTVANLGLLRASTPTTSGSHSINQITNRDVAAAVLATPLAYPVGWLISAAAAISSNDRPLRDAALANGWET